LCPLTPMDPGGGYYFEGLGAHTEGFIAEAMPRQLFRIDRNLHSTTSALVPFSHSRASVQYPDHSRAFMHQIPEGFSHQIRNRHTKAAYRHWRPAHCERRSTRLPADNARTQLQGTPEWRSFPQRISSRARRTSAGWARESGWGTTSNWPGHAHH
jgi:hypothetical protein